MSHPKARIFLLLLGKYFVQEDCRARIRVPALRFKNVKSSRPGPPPLKRFFVRSPSTPCAQSSSALIFAVRSLIRRPTQLSWSGDILDLAQRVRCPHRGNENNLVEFAPTAMRTNLHYATFESKRSTTWEIQQNQFTLLFNGTSGRAMCGACQSDPVIFERRSFSALMSLPSIFFKYLVSLLPRIALPAQQKKRVREIYVPRYSSDVL